MLAISVEFLHGTFRGDPDGTAVTGGLTRGEWPPSPARLFAALVSAGGTRQASRMTDGRELIWFEELPAPVIHAQTEPCHQKLQPRFVVAQRSRPAKSTHQEYPAREAALQRPGVRVALRNPFVVYRWSVEPPGEGIYQSLVRRAARVGYLGASDSPVRVRVVREMPRNSESEAFVPDPEGDMRIRVPRAGDVAVLDRMFDVWQERGASVTRSQFPALLHWESYQSPGSCEATGNGEVVAWLRVSPAVSGRRISSLTALFKAALLDRHQRMHGDPSAVLHGHGFREKGYDLARYLALPDTGYPRSRGRIHGLALWLPPGFDRDQQRKARDAAFSIDALVGQGVEVSVEPRGDEERPWAVHPRRWRGPSTIWMTAIPVIHERRGVPDLSEAARWCRHAGLPDPVAFHSSRAPLLPGAIDLAPSEVNRPERPALPYSHVEFRFAAPVTGPVVVGAGRQRGFGLCVPVDG
ncbi:MAG: type I-U CRISPR-associated protein Csb2 [Rhodospirillaceae bacterium]|nr:type I-U CRISPR-associated protein Csb2 [Rhodospirillaceae bacterium]